MKKKIGEIYNKPIVVGNKNEVTKNEVHVDEITNVQTGGGGSGGSDWHYYDYAVVENMLGNLPTALGGYMLIAKENNLIKAPYQVMDIPQAFAVDFNAKVTVEVFIPEENRVETRLGTILEALQEIEKWQDSNNSLSDIPEITEEEFYNLDE